MLSVYLFILTLSISVYQFCAVYDYPLSARHFTQIDSITTQYEGSVRITYVCLCEVHGFSRQSHDNALLYLKYKDIKKITSLKYLGSVLDTDYKVKCTKETACAVHQVTNRMIFKLRFVHPSDWTGGIISQDKCNETLGHI